MPIRESIERSSKPRSGIAHGGIGTGSLELRKDGIFRNWTIFNNEPLFGGAPYQFEEDSSLFFMVRWQEVGKHPQMKLLQIDEGVHSAGCLLQFYTFPWMSGVDRIESEACFPTTRLRFYDEEMPFDIELEALSPFVPGDVAASSIPGVYFRFHIRLTGPKPVEVLLMANLRHLVGYDVPTHRYAGRVSREGDAVSVLHATEGMDEQHASWGSMALSSLHGESSYQAGWSHRHTFLEPLLHQTELSNKDEIDGQNADNEELGARVATHECISTVGRSARLDPENEDLRHDFVLSWHFPNCYADQTQKDKKQGKQAALRYEGHAYKKRFSDALAVAQYLIGEREQLIDRSLAFQRGFYDSDLPVYVLDQINSQLNTFVASSWYTESGDFGIQEGWTPEKSWGPLATIDVGMYGAIAIAFLFPELDRSQWEVHRRLQFDSGDVCHGIGRNFGTGDKAESVKSRLDLAPQYVLMLLRHCFLTDDTDYLREVWPSVQKALAYTLEKRDQDGDGLPEMEGTMSTYDNFPMWGPASLIVGQVISALQHAEHAARILKDAEAEARWRAAREKAQAGMEAKLWNGTYFSLSNDETGEHGRDEGCLSDQLIGQWASRQMDLGDIVDRAKIDSALRAILARNFVRGQGLYNCRWPQDDWLHPVDADCWFDQANTYWTGVELGFAALLVHEGLVDEGFAVVEAVDHRHRKAGRYWDHQEWGGHYYRPMSAWGIVIAAAGFAAKSGVWSFRPALCEPRLRLFFSIGEVWGHYQRVCEQDSERISIKLGAGQVTLRGLELDLASEGRSVTVSLDGKAVPATVEKGDRVAHIRFDKPIVVSAESSLVVDC